VPYTISEPKRISDYILAYGTVVTDPDSKFSLMEMILEALDGQPSAEEMARQWELIKPLLTRNFSLHQYTIFYWCCWGNKNIDDCFEATPLLRAFWLEHEEP